MTFQEVTDELMRLYGQREYVSALELVEQNADSFPEHAARTTFWKMCLFSLCGRADDVISVFQRGLDAGLWWAERQFMDTDLDAVRELPEFKRLMEISIEKYQQAQEHIKPDRTLLVPDAAESTLPLLIALHGGGGNKESNLEVWEGARRRGWLVLSPQSTHSIFPNAYWWANNLEQRMRDIQVHYDEISQIYPIDRTRIVTTGMSQGSGMAIYAALQGSIPARGFISVAIGWTDFSEFPALAARAKHVLGYFVIGEKDHTLQSAHQIRTILRDQNLNFAEEIQADLGHEFPSDFGASFEKAIAFIFKERE